MNRQELIDKLREDAARFGRSVEAQAVDQLADMKTSARDSIIRAGVVALIVGVLIGKFVL